MFILFDYASRHASFIIGLFMKLSGGAIHCEVISIFTRLIVQVIYHRHGVCQIIELSRLNELEEKCLTQLTLFSTPLLTDLVDEGVV